MGFNPKKILSPGPVFEKQASIYGQPDAKGFVNGDIDADFSGYPLHYCRHAGNIADVSLLLAEAGQDDDNTLSMEVDVQINGVSCLSTKPKISYVSGEASGRKGTMVSGEYTDTIQSILDYDNISYVPGDIITFDGDITRTSSPDTEMAGMCVNVEFDPYLPK